MRNTALRRAQLWAAACLSGLGLLGALAWMPVGLDRVEPSRTAAAVAGVVTATVTGAGGGTADVMLGGQEVRLHETDDVGVGDEVRLYLTTEVRALVVWDDVVDGALVGIDAEQVSVTSTPPLVDQRWSWLWGMVQAWGPASFMLTLLVLMLGAALRRELAAFDPVTWFRSTSLDRGGTALMWDVRSGRAFLASQVALAGSVMMLAPDVVFERVGDVLSHGLNFLLGMTMGACFATMTAMAVGVLDQRLAVTSPSQWGEGALLELLLNGGASRVDMADPLLAGIERDTLTVLSKGWSGTLEELLTTARLLGPDVEGAEVLAEPAVERDLPPQEGFALRRSLVGVV